MTERRVALGTAAVAGAAFVVLAIVLVPWDPVPGGPLPEIDPREVFSEEHIARAEDYSRWARVWSWSGLAVSLLTLGLLAFTERGRRLFARLPGPWWVQVVLAVLIVRTIVRVVTLPFAAAGREHSIDYGLTTSSWGLYATDLLKNLAVDVAVTSLVLVVVVACARRWRTWWPAVVAALVGALVMLGSFVYPVLIEPLFNDFESLPESELRAEVFRIAEAEGVDVEDVLVVDASRRTTRLNAYVSGYGGTRRVVLYDTLVDTLPRDQALSVVAHELAHAKHSDVVVGSVLGATGAMAGVGLLALLAGALRRREASETGSPAVVPVVLALVAIAGLASAPIQNGISRQIESRADVEALQATQGSGGFVPMQRQLAQRSLSDPNPPTCSHFWFGSHPTTLQRIAMARRVAETP